MDYRNSPNSIPKEEHYAVLLFDTIHIPGEERSRTNPGHGYPASTETAIKYITFKDREELQQWILLKGDNKNFLPIMSKPLEVVKSVSVELK